MDRRGRLLAVAVALLIACSDPPADESTGRGSAERPQAEVPVLESARGDPGTRLRDGFVVAEGTTLIGPVMPNGVFGAYDGVPVVDEGWSATLFAHGEPRQVMEAYLSQAESLGFVREDGPDENTWGLQAGVPEEDQQPAMCAGLGVHEGQAPEEGVYGCAARAVIHSHGDPAVCFSLHLTRGEARGRSTSHLRLDYYYASHEEAEGQEPLCAGDAFVVGNPSDPVPELPDAWPPLPAPGESLLASTPVADIRVLEGSTMVAPPFGDWCATAVLEVTGDAGGLLDGYLAQYEQLVGPPAGLPRPVTRRVTEIDDNTTLYQDSRAVGAGHPWAFYADLLVADDGPDWLQLDFCSEE